VVLLALRHLTVDLICGENIRGAPSREEAASAMGHSVETQGKIYDVYKKKREAQGAYDAMGNVRKYLRISHQARQRRFVVDEEGDDIEVDLDS
jgi:hypothetical protein